jgi:dipeptidyl aminopeptidase/acylaminoacyl peptidase
VIRTGCVAVALTIVVGVSVVDAQPAAATRTAVTAADYARAERLLPAALNPLVTGGSVNVSWLPDDRFTYRNPGGDTTQFLLVDPVAKTRVPAFDHARLAAALAAAAGTRIDAARLPFQTITLSADAAVVSFDVAQKRYSCDAKGNACKVTGTLRANSAVSPDGTRAVFIKDWNLWVRDLESGVERPLTTDGVPNFGYATDNAGWKTTARPIVLWSPDSRRVATFQQDEREVGEMYLVEAKVGHPQLRAWKYPLVGDAVVAMLHRVVIDVESGSVTRLAMAPDYHRAMLGDDVSVDDWSWSPDASKLAFVSTSRDHKKATVRLADAATGAVRTVFEESEETHFEAPAGWRVLWATNEVVWNSQRDDWSQLYLYDLASGRLKNQITSGAGPVTRILRVDEKARVVYFTANGREPGQDLYFAHLYRTGLDGKGYASLTPADRHHIVQLSPTGRFAVVTASTPEHAPETVVRDNKGTAVMALEKTDISKLVASGWQPPTSFTVKARDGKTELYGQMFRPSDFDPEKKYPIINDAYPGPQRGSIGSRAFAAARGDRQALAELGFIVVSIDGMGTPGRSKSFHDAYYGAMGRDNTLPDQVAGMKELASRYPWIDIDRAAILGHSGGGFIAADALLRYPDFFKVGIAESGNHDQRLYEDDWGERYQGLLVKDAKGGPDNYEAEANQTLAKNLKGKLFLLHGMMDNNVPPQSTYLLMEALIKANKDFDLLLLPTQQHGYGSDSTYVMRRRWDYFVRNLLGEEPPKEYQIQTGR